MKTPVDPVVRIQKREVDDLKRRIADHASQQSHLMVQESRIDDEIADQYRFAATEWALSVHAFARRKLAERARLSHQRRLVETALGELRDNAAQAYGRLRAAEQVAEGYRDEMRGVISRAEQAGADDFAISRYRVRNGQLQDRRDERRIDDRWA